MSSRYQAGIVLPGYNALKVANAPTIGTATDSATSGTVSVAFTAPACVGGGAISSYTAYANCGVYKTTGASSPLAVTGLTNGTAYTFKVIATNVYGPSFPSAASNSATPTAPVVGQDAFTTAGTFTWVAPTGVTRVSAVAVSGGSGGTGKIPCGCFSNYSGISGPGGGLAYVNNYTVVPGTSYNVVVGNGGASTTTSTRNRGAFSSFVSTGVLRSPNCCVGGVGTAFYSGGGGNNNSGSKRAAGGGGAAGYSGAGGGGAACICSGTAGSGGGGGGGAVGFNGTCNIGGGGGGGGVGLLGQGSNGARGTEFGGGGGGGSGGAAGSTGAMYNGGAGGAYGGGGGTGEGQGGGVPAGNSGGAGAVGAVRIIYPGTTRSFPSTNTGNL